jgi:hypothetical protein
MVDNVAGSAQGNALHWQRWQLPVGLIGGIGVLLLMVHWGGNATTGPLLIAGISALVAMIVLFAWLIYWFYLSPMPHKQLALSTPSATVRQVLATGVTVMGLLFIIGGFWDEVWHRVYGVGEVIDDFWWPPHIMIYVSVGLNACFALGGMAFIMLRGKGTMRQRFRREPLLGLLTLAGGFQVLTTPLDPLWHELYGLDLTAWSLPHLILGIGLVAVMLVGASIQRSLIAAGEWRGLQGFTLQEVVMTILFTLSVILLCQFGTTEWESIEAIGSRTDPFFARPEWLYPVVIATIAAFIGMTALYHFRRVGIVTVIFGLALLARVVLLVSFDALAEPASMSFKANVFLMVPAIALDLWYAYRLRQGLVEATRTPLWGSLLMAGVMLGVLLPVISQVMLYPRVNSSTLPGMIGFSLLMAVVAGWAGWQIGQWLLRQGQGAVPVHTHAESTNFNQIIRWGAAALAMVIMVVAYFIATARPPVV